MAEPRTLPKEIQRTLAKWQRKAVLWESLHYTVGIAALISMPLTHTLSYSDLATTQPHWLHLACAANVIFVALITFLQPRTHARVYWRAYYRLHTARLHFLGHPRASMEKLWEAVIEAERYLVEADEHETQDGPMLFPGDATVRIDLDFWRISLREFG